MSDTHYGKKSKLVLQELLDMPIGSAQCKPDGTPTVIRVPGGWIYLITITNNGSPISSSGIFVPEPKVR